MPVRRREIAREPRLVEAAVGFGGDGWTPPPPVGAPATCYTFKCFPPLTRSKTPSWIRLRKREYPKFARNFVGKPVLMDETVVVGFVVKLSIHPRTKNVMAIVRIASSEAIGRINNGTYSVLDVTYAATASDVTYERTSDAEPVCMTLGIH